MKLCGYILNAAFIQDVLAFNCICNFFQMMLTKMLLTEILLDVTNEEIYYVAKDVHRKATKGMLGLGSFFLLISSSKIMYLHVFRTFNLHSSPSRTIPV